ncbi:TPA: hypothetical protein DDW69_01670 [candidate division CPR2 bacterium]|uniref:Prepilin-type N-terminal cleavage/methylation domain-containing protein n=1 Tax=candidate division CPR2 bacterium GW2011_GWC1_41_48 TaxID=1618344 RepID=A0A0G0WCF5_UNCC2|nr:MAG: hypothetical protein UT47_C0001G0137 [candidate division CPR2 bacterium GW2011_GWC2_39_35]KKR29437.1 MAG: hypothetical protein UT60_C0002G0028 [candidate division CPR2 bacterium GW2011_GWD2_39_7]KKS09732.1 MAG: hypothetical protein UU65_C0001G0137 [candidate division CPR2 bacterium GW2011_GWC1_41_48]OGB71257.1 MAG: hypothetical protein A2Y26_00565 [candidate division CPR2 bacterium GWD2_39_7]HBG81529.1 hypothetical protein [candidate division CPR2 bacterium]
MKKNAPLKRGFTLIEVIIVVSVIGLLSISAASGYLNYQKSTEIKENSGQVAAFMREAQSNATSQKLNKKWGVNLNNDGLQMTLFDDSMAGENKRYYNLPKQLKFDSVSINGGGNDIIFDKMTGETSNYGTAANNIAFKIINILSNESVSISIAGSGKIEVLE